MKWVLRRRLPLAPGERFAYTNAAYLMLGAVVEEASGQDYESYCRNTLLATLGVRGAALDPAWRILASYGGWRMPLADYGRFYQAFAANNHAIGPAAPITALARWCGRRRVAAISGTGEAGPSRWTMPSTGTSTSPTRPSRCVERPRRQHGGLHDAVAGRCGCHAQRPRQRAGRRRPRGHALAVVLILALAVDERCSMRVPNAFSHAVRP